MRYDSQTGMSRGRVLVVDDEPGLADMTAELLSYDGFTVDTAYDAESATRLINGDSPLVMLATDVNFPMVAGGNPTEASGQYLAREVRRVRPDVPILVLTGRPENERLFEGYQNCRFAVKGARVNKIILEELSRAQSVAA